MTKETEMTEATMTEATTNNGEDCEVTQLLERAFDAYGECEKAVRAEDRCERRLWKRFQEVEAEAAQAIAVDAKWRTFRDADTGFKAVRRTVRVARRAEADASHALRAHVTKMRALATLGER